MTALERQRRMLCEYIRNTAQVPLRPVDFDDDWEPVGETYRDDLQDEGLIEQREPGEGEPGGIYLTAAGKALAGVPAPTTAETIPQP